MASQNSSSLISSIHKSRSIILDLMKRQDYDISAFESTGINETNAMYSKNQLDILLEKKDEDEKTKRKNKVYIKYYLLKSLKAQNIQEMIDDLFILEEILTTNDTLYIIIKEEVNDTLKNTLKHIWEQEKIFIVIISLRRLQFNILEHNLVPIHRVIQSETELNKIKQKYNIMDNTQFPEISRFDPVAQAIGIKPNEVCEIIRPSKTSITSKYYRICMNT